ncbi:MAG: metallophosphoesterase [Thermoplasmata archaeon]
MEDATIRPLPGAPALVVSHSSGRSATSLVISDVHLGYGATHDRPEGPPPASIDDLADRVLEATRAAGAGTLLIAGDVKHPIVGVPAALRPGVRRFFVAILGEGLRVEIVPGNHDVGLGRCLPGEVRLHPPSGALHRGIGIFHGHRWPSDRVARAPRIVVGHLHPGVRLAPTADDPTGKRRCWVRLEGPFPPPRPGSRRRAEGRQEVIVLPAFNPIAGVESLNREKPRRGRSFLVRRFLSSAVARGFLLDGTDIGSLAGLTPAPAEPRGSGTTPRAS